MVTFKQLEAFHRIAACGSFVAASQVLGTTQSGLSRRISEMEAVLGVELFDRSHRTVQLTVAGHAVLKFCDEILAARARLMTAVGQDLAYVGPLRIGITELVALTFLPDLVAAIKLDFPRIALQPEVDLRTNLLDKMTAGRLSFAIMPGHPPPGDFHTVRLGEVELAWMCSPTRLECPDRLSLKELSRFPLLTQTNRSALQAMVNEFFRSHETIVDLSLSSNSLTAICGMAVAGLGIGLLPRQQFQPYLTSGQLKVVVTDPVAPSLPYFAAYPSSSLDAVCGRIAAMAQSVWRQ